MLQLLFTATTLALLFLPTAADALTRKQAVAECRQQYSSYTRRQADRTGLTRKHMIDRCVKEKMQGTKR